MPEFCKDCPLRFEATEELIDVKIGNYSRMEDDTKYEYEVGVVVDTDQNHSLPIRISNETEESLLEKIDECQSPIEVETERLFRSPRIDKKCGALGKLALIPGSNSYKAVMETL